MLRASSAGIDGAAPPSVSAQHGREPLQFLARHRLVERDADARVADAPQVEALRQRGLHQRIGACGLDRDRVEERVVHHAMAALSRRIGQQPRLQVHPPRDALQPFGPVPHRVAAGDHRQQHLRGADVRRRLLAPDVLLARLQARAASPADRPHPATRRPAVRACGACRHRASPCSRRADRRSPSARRSAATNPPPHRHPSRPAASAAPAPADRRRR